MALVRYLAFCLLLLPHAALAQSKSQPKPSAASKPSAAPAPNAAAPANNAEPQIVTTNFGDWALRCQRVGDLPQSNCEVSLTIQEKNQPGPIAQIALGRPANSGVHVLVLLPNNVSFPSSVQIKSDDKDVWSIDIPWKRCIPGACIAETALTDADIVRWRNLENVGKLSFKDASANEVLIGFPFRGLTPALDALNKQMQ